MNFIIRGVAITWFFAQVLKVLYSSLKKKKLSLKPFFMLGGMPSSHSTLVSALATAVGFVEGFNSSIFLITLVFAVIVIHDALRIRRQHTYKEALVGIFIGVLGVVLVRIFLP